MFNLLEFHIFFSVISVIFVLLHWYYVLYYMYQWLSDLYVEKPRSLTIMTCTVQPWRLSWPLKGHIVMQLSKKEGTCVCRSQRADYQQVDGRHEPHTQMTKLKSHDGYTVTSMMPVMMVKAIQISPLTEAVFPLPPLSTLLLRN